MKYLFLIIGFLFIQNLSAQSAHFLINFGGNLYHPSKIYMEDGTVKEGYLLEFADENMISFGLQKFIESLTTVENQRGWKREFYYFRETEKGKDQKILLSDIKRIDVKIFNRKTEKERIDTYEKVNLARVNNNLEIQSENEYVLLPLYLSTSKIAVYAYSVSNCDDWSSINCRASMTHDFYFRKQEEEFAIKPLDGNLFTIGKMQDKFYKSFEYLGKDCPEFLTYLDEMRAEGEKNAPKKKVMVLSGKKMKEMFQTKEYESYERDIKKMKKKLDRKEFKIYEIERKNQFFDEMTSAFYDKVYNELIINYINSCE